MRAFLQKNLAIAVLMIALLLAGCSGSAGTDGVIVQGAGSQAGDVAIFGKVDEAALPDAEGAVVSVLAAGTPVALVSPCQVDSAGRFIAKLSTTVPTGPVTVRVTTAGGEAWRTELEGLAPDGHTFVYVGPLTTLCHAFHAKRPELSVAQVRSAVHGYLKIPARFDFGDEVAHERYSGFSSSKLLSDARKYPGGPEAYLEHLTSVIGRPAPAEAASRLFESPPPVPSPIVPSENVANTVADSMSAASQAETTVASSVGEAFSITGAIGDAFVDEIVGIGFDFIPGIGVSWEIDQVLDELADISYQLDQIELELSNLAQSIGVEFTQANYLVLTQSVNQNVAAISSMYRTLQAINASVGQDQSPSNLETQQNELHGMLSAPNDTANPTSSYNQYVDATAIHLTEVGGPTTPATQTHIYLARQYSNALNYLISNPVSGGAGTGPLDFLYSHVEYYTGLLSESMFNIVSVSAPMEVLDSTGTHLFYTWQDSPGAQKTTVKWEWLKPISDNIQEEIAYLPFYPTSADHAIVVSNKTLFQRASIDGSPGWNYYYAENLQSGGLNWNWGIADTTSILSLFKTVGGSPTSYSAALNACQFELHPGPVGYIGSRLAPVVCTPSGFLTVDVSYSDKLYWVDFGWVDDQGHSGTIVSGMKFANIDGMRAGVANLLESNYQGPLPNTDFSNNNPSIVFYGGNFYGPMMIMYKGYPGAPLFDQEGPTFAPVVMGYYDAISVQRNSANIRLDWGSTTAWEQLQAFPVEKAGVLYSGTDIGSFDLSSQVYWTSSDPVNAPVFNTSPSTAPAPTPAPSPPDLLAQGLGCGTVLWQSGSCNKQVTFTATRYLNDGTTAVSGSVTLLSPIASPNLRPPADAISVWPTAYAVTGAELNTTGVNVFVTLHFTNGDSADDSAGNLTFESSNPAVSVTRGAGANLIARSNVILPPGTQVVISITDQGIVQNQVPDDNKRPTVQTTITVR